MARAGARRAGSPVPAAPALPQQQAKDGAGGRPPLHNEGKPTEPAPPDQQNNHSPQRHLFLTNLLYTPRALLKQAEDRWCLESRHCLHENQLHSMIGIARDEVLSRLLTRLVLSIRSNFVSVQGVGRAPKPQLPQWVSAFLDDFTSTKKGFRWLRGGDFGLPGAVRTLRVASVAWSDAMCTL